MSKRSTQSLIDLARPLLQQHGTLDPRRYDPVLPGLLYSQSLYRVPYVLHPAPARVMVLGSGGGMDAEMALLSGAGEVDAVDISPDALAVAQQNINDYGLQDRVHPIPSDLFANLKGRQYDLIISNPPYVDAESVATLPPEYLHEPKLALGSGNDGLDATRAILQNAAQYLTKNGILIVEIGHNRDALEEAFPDLPFTWLDVTAGDQFVFMLHRNDLL